MYMYIYMYIHMGIYIFIYVCGLQTFRCVLVFQVFVVVFQVLRTSVQMFTSCIHTYILDTPIVRHMYSCIW